MTLHSFAIVVLAYAAWMLGRYSYKAAIAVPELSIGTYAGLVFYACVVVILLAQLVPW